MRARALAACPRPRTPRPRRRPPAAPCAASRRTARAPRRRGSARARRGRAAAPPLARTRPPRELAHGRTRAPCRSRPEGNGGAEGGGRGRRGWVGGRASVERVWRRPAPPPAPLSTKTHDTMSFHSTQCCTYVLLPSKTSGRSKRTASRRACCGRSRTPAPTRARRRGGWVGCVHGRTRHTAGLAGWLGPQSATVGQCAGSRPAVCRPGAAACQRPAPPTGWVHTRLRARTALPASQHQPAPPKKKKKTDSLNFERRSAFVDVETNAHFPSKGSRNAAMKQQSRYFSLYSACLYVEMVVDFSYRCRNIRWSSSSCLTCDLRWREEQRGGGRGGVARARGRRGTHRTRSTPPAPPPPPSQSPCRSSCP